MKTELKRNLRITLVFTLIMITIMGYSQIVGSGKIVSESRSTDDFSKIKLSCSADLFITQGSTSVRVKADDNIVGLLETNVENGTLSIEIKGRGFRSANTLEVYISVPELSNIKNSGSGDISIKNGFKGTDLYIGISGSGDLEADLDALNLQLKVSGSGDSDISGIRGMLKVTNSGSGDFEAENLKLEDCDISNSGSGDIELSGKTNNLKVRMMGSGDLDAYNLTSVNVEVKNSGSSDLTLNVVENLKVTLNGSGDVTYRGDPTKVDVRSNGSGDIYKK